MKGSFSDDYGIRYSISDTMFEMSGSTKYHILKWNKQEQFLLAKNDSTNQTDGGRYTRIDYTLLTDMAPYNWGTASLFIML